MLSATETQSNSLPPKTSPREVADAKYKALCDKRSRIQELLNDRRKANAEIPSNGPAPDFKPAVQLPSTPKVSETLDTGKGPVQTPLSHASAVRATKAMPPKSPVKTTAPLVFPPEAIVGSLGDLARELSQGSEVPPEFVFACALTVFGAGCSGQLSLATGNEVDPRLYTILLGQSYEAKKSTAREKVLAFFADLSAQCGSDPTLDGKWTMPQVCRGAGSAEGLIRDLKTHKKVLLTYDEFRTFFDKAKVQSSVLLPAVTSLFESHSWGNVIRSTAKSFEVEDARLSFLACSTYDTYNEIWNSEAISIGYPNRLFIVSAERKRKVAWAEAPNEERLIQIRGRLREQVRRLPLTFGISPEAKRLWEQWYENIPSSIHAKRLDTIGLRLLATLALTTDKTQIEPETVETVKKILAYELAIRQETDPISADNLVAKVEQLIRRALTRGPKTKRQLQQAVHADRCGVWAWRQALSNLSNITGEVKSDREGFYWLVPDLEETAR